MENRIFEAVCRNDFWMVVNRRNGTVAKRIGVVRNGEAIAQHHADRLNAMHQTLEANRRTRAAAVTA